MGKERLTIGELARASGVTVKTLRFYSDLGLLPPSERSLSRYRLYDHAAVLRLDLIRTLREAGLSLESIERVLRREMSLSDALRLRLCAVEAHVASLQRVRAALRAALRAEPTPDDVRRLCAVTRLSNEERKAVIADFYERVSEGIPIDDRWKRQMIEASAPNLPDDASPEQLDAWVELSEIVADPGFIESLRASAKDVWGNGLDMVALRAAGDEAAAAAHTARECGITPESAAAQPIVERYALELARIAGKPLDAKIRRGMRERFERHDPRAGRYWELIAIINGQPPMASKVEDWAWVRTAACCHLL